MKVENSSVLALDFALPGGGAVVVVKELDCNVLCNNLSSLSPPPHKMAPGAFELEGSRLGGICVGVLINVESKTPERHCGQSCVWVLLREAGGWQVTSGLEMELPSLPQSQELGRSLQRDFVSRRKTNQNAK